MLTSSKWLPVGLAMVVAPSFYATSARAAVFSASPVSDAFVTTGPSGNLSGNNYGGAGALGVSAPGLAKGAFDSVLQFDVSGAIGAFNSQYGAGQWTIQSVSLQLTATPPNNGIFNATSPGQFQINWMQNNSWTEGTGTPNAPTATGITYATLQSTFVGSNDENLGIFSFGGATNGAASYNLNLTPGFTTELLSGGGISLEMFAADPNISYLFDSRNFGSAGSRPVLSIDAVPEPGTSLWILGIACCAGWRRFARRRNA